MSLDLLCPNCGSKIGETSNENNYKEIYYHKNKMNEPFCDNCNVGKDGYLESSKLIFTMFWIMFFCLIFLISIL